MSDNVLPTHAKPKLIVVVAFDRDDDGELFTAYGPTDQQSEDRAIRTAKGLSAGHAGVIAWSRDADPALGDYGPPTTLFVSGEVPDME
ncbi:MULTISPECIES: hypothetical protein [unclassified Mesorhizobium]|uniref:hypothetical protein n=1 Tax=unclassified Mesorhizobium TaxID=325217 RepID=UPI000FCC1ECE|nr:MULTISPECIES: hypothetical protein [unclassified Mesorhizobium]RUZ25239.1 hypothetical protein EN949_14485 [Mesorhizobium sp. M7A.F.Ca.US.007.01.2.1]RUZ49879.1 hypothetical protein EN948_03020 [Mesorhizobium sp. M7A.F.Ca.US.003.02.1.1]RUZ70314.1 hypothetical protein EN950_01050 [Mesorhizobium sp. M7A.F.Ca.US.007.01.1.1]